ncbi:hypothetical protein CBW65_10030 [Tumebacillus avium]|uniref:DUF4340 domain-containing protein n=1 Tax=Tumebacillus avium TaxID=1903704 RepID=A0A1Y0IP71_9BACL|nr:hypothetical protein [Tumebacillus avium]ARU61295.1 hypothetical protein CBW65_10030 [Tumebacillus avium]
MKFSKRAALVTSLLLIVAVLIGVYLLTMNKGRNLPNDVLHGPVDEIKVVKGVNDVHVLTQPSEIKTLLGLLETDRWEAKNLKVKCMPDYTLLFNKDTTLGLMCINNDTGYSKIEYQDKTYYYTLPVDTYKKVAAFLDELYQ